MSIDEKKEPSLTAQVLDNTDSLYGALPVEHASGEKDVFDHEVGGVEFRTQGWIRTSIFMLKMTFSSGVLTIPGSFLTIGLIAGIIFILFFGFINTYMSYIMGQFKQRHPSMHALPDAIRIMAGEWNLGPRTTQIAVWYTEALYLLTWILAAGINMLGFGIGLNAVSKHATCSVVFNTVAAIVITAISSVRKMSHLAWVTWVGLISILAAVMVVIIAVTIPDRPPAAPQTGDFDLGFSLLPAAATTFPAALSAVLGIFVSSGNTPGFIPVISEMKRPQDYNKALFWCMGFINTSYVAFSTVVFYYCGKWVTSPALGSAGPTLKIVAYGVAIPGLIAGAMTVTHIAGKSLFVRILRNSRHLTANTKTHWTVWLSCTSLIGFLGWLLAESIPFFSQLIALIGCLCFGFTSIIVPTAMWFSLNPVAWSGGGRGRVMYVGHLLIMFVGLFITIAGTYAVIATIVNAFAVSDFGGAFSCADNSGTLV